MINNTKLRKFRRCPHCKSKKGFTLEIDLGGSQTEIRTFDGKLVDLKREGIDKIHYAECLECKRAIDYGRLDIDL